MKCNIGLMSEFLRSRRNTPEKTEFYNNLDNAYVLGHANLEGTIIWVFVDEIAQYGQHMQYIIDQISLTTVHELIHACGRVADEEAVNYGELLVMYDGL